MGCLRSLICSIFWVDFAIEGRNDESVLDSITSLGDNCPESPDVIGFPQTRFASSTDSDRSGSDFMGILLSQITEKSFWVCVSPVFTFFKMSILNLLWLFENAALILFGQNHIFKTNITWQRIVPKIPNHFVFLMRNLTIPWLPICPRNQCANTFSWDNNSDKFTWTWNNFVNADPDSWWQTINHAVSVEKSKLLQTGGGHPGGVPGEPPSLPGTITHIIKSWLRRR